MNNKNPSFKGSIPEKYDKHLGPFLFNFFSDDIVKRLSALKLNAILEIACGTGIVTGKLINAFLSAEITATDINPDMLQYAKSKFSGESNITWKTADAMKLPFDDNSFEAVICQMGVMFFPDKQTAFNEAFRVLKPGGIFIFNTMDTIEANDVSYTVNETLKNLFKDNHPNFFEIVFSLHNKEQIEKLLRNSGFKDVMFNIIDEYTTGKSAHSVATGLIEGTPVSNQIIQMNTIPIQEVQNEVEKAIAAKHGDNPVKGKVKAIVCSGRK
jgi:ubiquinone/menaquinone biosynthesis C-methylase UbiE